LNFKFQKRKQKVLTSELFEPALAAVEGASSADIVDDESSNGASVVSGSDSSEALLARSVPDLRLDLLAVDLHHLRLELHPNGGL